MISPIMAHKVKGVDQHYSSHDYKELLAKYETALPFLLPQTVEKIKSELDQTKTEYRKTVSEQQKQIDELGKMVKMLWTKGNFVYSDEEKIMEAKRLHDSKNQQ